jgi:hypothetical protein
VRLPGQICDLIDERIRWLMATAPVWADGVTPITHGWNPALAGTPGWLGAMCDDIAVQHLDGQQRYGTITVTGGAGNLTATCNPWNILVVLFPAAIGLATAPLVHADVLEVGPGKTYATIQAAVNAANAGDEIYVYPGTYNESVDLSQDVTISGSSSTNNGGAGLEIYAG